MASLKKKPKPQRDEVVSGLKKENAFLKKALFELSRQHHELVQEFLSLEKVRAQSLQQQTPKDEKMPMDSDPDKQALTIKVNELQNHLNDALAKNKQWLDYDQQRETYVRGLLDRMLWLEKHAVEKGCITQLQEHLEVLRAKVDITHQELKITQNWCKEKEEEIEELKRQREIKKNVRESTPESHYCSEAEEQQPRNDETKALQSKLDEEKRRSASFQLQANVCQKLMLNSHHEDQEKIENLEHQNKISAQDCEDARQDNKYLKKQMVRVLKIFQKTTGKGTKKSKKDQQDCYSCEEGPSTSTATLTSPTDSSTLNESALECPGCSTEYPASQYQELITHLEDCLN